MINVGRVCVKLRGREAGKICAVVKKLDEKFVIIDGPEVKRRRCNIAHLEPLPKTIDIKEDAPHEEVVEKLKTISQ